MIGNDIIDLNELCGHPRSDSVRFQRKILSDLEMGWLRLSANPKIDIWKLWAVKESAYKCYFQRTHHRFFAPKKFICEWRLPATIDHQTTIVTTPMGRLQATCCQSDHHIHAMCSDDRAWLAKAKPYVISIPGRSARTQSNLLRKAALERIAQYVNGRPGELTWDDTAGHPRVRRQGVLLPISISLSHHGRWGAVVFRSV